MNIDYTDLQKALSHVLYLIKKCSLQRARIKQKQLKSKFFLTISYNVNIIRFTQLHIGLQIANVVNIYRKQER